MAAATAMPVKAWRPSYWVKCRVE